MNGCPDLPGQLPAGDLPAGSRQVPTEDTRFPRSEQGLDLPGQVTGRSGQGPCPTARDHRSGQAGNPPASCIRGPKERIGERVLRDRHDDHCSDDGCPGCLPCPGPHCLTCQRRHAEVTCPTCLSVARENLDVVGQYVEELPHQAVNGRQAYHQSHGIPGGDALVMLAPASPHRPIGSTRPVYSELGDPRPPLDVLAYWSNRWREEANQPTDLPPTMPRVLEHLDGQLHRMADTPLFHRLARDLARLLHQVENVLHAGDRPDRSRVPCLGCGTRLVKVWADTEVRDHWRCPLCGEVYDQGRYERAKHDQLASRGADRFVPLPDALAVTGRPEQTVRTWVRLGYVETRKAPGSGRLEVWWPDVRDRHRTTPTRRRLA